MFKKISTLLILIFSVAQAHAGFELRAHYGQWTGTPKDYNDDLTAQFSSWPKIESPSVLGADALFVMPLIPFEFGLRYETFETKKSTSISGVKIGQDVKGSRVSLLGGYRLLNNPLMFLGALAHIGVSQKMDGTVYATPDVPFTGTMNPSYGLGVEGGVNIGMALIGAEVGYTTFKAKNLKDSSGSTYQYNSKDVPIDFSGPYFMVLVGVNL